jgi:acetyl-CoA/propionyl-CoA carboxylase biotin carboxyl carrier protein
MAAALPRRGEIRIADGRVSVEGTEHAQLAEVRPLGAGRFAVELDGIAGRYAVAIAPDGTVWAGRDGHQLELRPATAQRAAGARPGGSLEAPMPGVVLQVRVADGEPVREGDVLLVLESMKMELAISAPRDGVVAGLTLKAGDRVERRQPLVSVVDGVPG